MPCRTNLILGSLLALAPITALAQEPDIRPTTFLIELLGSMGFSAEKILWCFLALFVFSWAALYAATRLCGLPATIGRTVLVVLVTILVSIPIYFLLFLLLLAVGPGALTILVYCGHAAAMTLAVKWIYSTEYGRALLVYLVSSLLSAWCMIVLLVLLF